MKLFSVTVLLASCLTVAALDDSLKVPGESPADFCNADRDNDALQLEKLDLAPNPPQPGKSVVVTLTGTVKKTITSGSYAKVIIKYGLIQLIATTVDFCEQANNVDMSCPIEPGKITVIKSVDLPQAIPPGTYNLAADLYTDDDEQITCLKGTVNFPRPMQEL